MNYVLNEKTFSVKSANADGRQPWCKRCDAQQKREPAKRWPSFRRALIAEGAEIASQWTAADYFEVMTMVPRERARKARLPMPITPVWECFYCGSDVLAWSGGHCVDRQSSARGHVKSNCVPCCWPCNRFKNDMFEPFFRTFIDWLRDRYPPGQIPWNEIRPGFNHVDSVLPDLSEFVVADTQLRLLP